MVGQALEVHTLGQVLVLALWESLPLKNSSSLWSVGETRMVFGTFLNPCCSYFLSEPECLSLPHKSDPKGSLLDHWVYKEIY